MGTTRVNAATATTTTTTTRTRKYGRVACRGDKAAAAGRPGTNGFFERAPLRFSARLNRRHGHATAATASEHAATRRERKVNAMQQQRSGGGGGFYALGLVGTLVLIVAAQRNAEARAADIFTNAFLVKMKGPADRAVADRVAARNGFVNLGSAANAVSWSDSLKAVKDNVEQVIDKAISKVEEEFVSNQLKTITVAAELSEGTTKFGDKIWNLISSVTKNVTVEISELTSAVEGVNINECTKMSDRLGNIAKSAIASTSACINKKLNTGFAYIETINKVSNDVMVELTEIREKAQHCGEHIDGAKSAANAIFCAKTAASDATWISVKAAPKLAIGWSRLTFLLVTLQRSFAYCDTNKQLANFYNEAATVVDRTSRCIEQKLDQIRPTTPEVPEEVEVTTPEVHEEVEVTTPEVHEEVEVTEATTPEVHEEVEVTTPEVHEEVEVTEAATPESHEEVEENHSVAPESHEVEETHESHEVEENHESHEQVAPEIDARSQ